MTLIENILDEPFSGHSYSAVFSRDYVIQNNGEGGTLAYWYGGPVDELEKVDPQADELALLEFLKRQELAYILTVGLVKVDFEGK